MKATNRTPRRTAPFSQTLSRRGFLRKSGFAMAMAQGVGGAFLWGQTGLGKAAVVGANEKIRLGVVGCGGRGRDVLGVFLNHTDIDCPVICDVDDAMLAKGSEFIEQKRGRKPEQVKDFRRLIERKDV